MRMISPSRTIESSLDLAAYSPCKIPENTLLDVVHQAVEFDLVLSRGMRVLALWAFADRKSVV